MGVGGVFDVDGIEPVGPIPHAAKAPRAGTLDDPRNEVSVARSPDQTRTKRAGQKRFASAQRRPVGLENHLLGDRLGLGIVGQVGLGIAGRLGDPLQRLAGVGHARASGVDQPRDAGGNRRVEDMARPVDVYLVEGALPKTETGLGGGVKDRVDPPAGPPAVLGAAKVAQDKLDPQLFELGELTAAESPDGVAAGHQPLDDVLP